MSEHPHCPDHVHQELSGLAVPARPVRVKRFARSGKCRVVPVVIGLDASSLPTGRNRRAARVPLARLELWRRRRQLYARLAPDGDVVTVAEFEVQRLTELLKAVVESGRLRRPPEDKAQPLRLWRTRKLRLKA
jgi:hypothetical protein